MNAGTQALDPAVAANVTSEIALRATAKANGIQRAAKLDFIVEYLRRTRRVCPGSDLVRSPWYKTGPARLSYGSKAASSRRWSSLGESPPHSRSGNLASGFTPQGITHWICSSTDLGARLA